MDEIAVSASKRAAVASALAASLPGSAVVADGEDLKPYECDGLTAYRAAPLVVALPANEAQVAAVLAVAARRGTPVVARGAGTGLSGGALPLGDGVLLSLAKFNAHRCASIRSRARARVQPGVRNLRRSRDASRRSACTTRPIPRARSPARSAATWPRTRAACIA